MKTMIARLIVLLIAPLPVLAAVAAVPASRPAAAVAPTAAHPAPPIPARDGWPDTRVGAIARDWVTAFGAGEDSMAACLTRILPAESLAKRPMSERLVTYRRLHDDLGTLTLFSIDHQSSTELSATLVAADMSKQSFTFTIQSAAPWQLVSVKTMQGMHGHFPGLGWLHH